MKKSIFIFLLLISLTSLVFAKPILEFQNEDVQKDETILGKISSQNQLIKTNIDEIIFYEGRREVFFDYEIKPYDKSYYFYIYANRNGNFSLEIPNVLYETASGIKEETIKKEFEIKEPIKEFDEEKNSLTKVLSIRPGLLFSSNQDKITLINNGNSQINLSIQDEIISLESKKSHEIISDPNTLFYYINISSYKDFKIPVISLKKVNEKNNSLSSINFLRPDPESIFENINSKKETIKNITFYNFENKNLTIKSISTNISFLSFEKLEKIRPKEVFNFSLIFNPKSEGEISGNLNITYESNNSLGNLIIPINLFVFPNGTNIKEIKLEEETCEKIGGLVCTYPSTCLGNKTFTSDAPICCLGTCSKEKEETENKNYSLLFGSLIILILISISYLVYQKYKKTKPKKAEDKIKELSKNYEKKVSGKLDRG